MAFLRSRPRSAPVAERRPEYQKAELSRPHRNVHYFAHKQTFDSPRVRLGVNQNKTFLWCGHRGQSHLHQSDAMHGWRWLRSRCQGDCLGKFSDRCPGDRRESSRQKGLLIAVSRVRKSFILDTQTSDRSYPIEQLLQIKFAIISEDRVARRARRSFEVV